MYSGVWLLILLAWIPCSWISGAYVLWGIFVPNAVMPTLVFVFFLIFGIDEKWGHEKWALIPVGIVFVLSPWYFIDLMTSGLSHLSSVDVPTLNYILAFVCSIVGMLIGLGIRLIKRAVIKSVEKGVKKACIHDVVNTGFRSF